MWSMPARRIVIVVYPGFQPLDAVGPAEAFGGAARLVPGSYEVTVVAPERVSLESRFGGFGLLPASSLAECIEPIDTLIVAGGFGSRTAHEIPGLINWIRDAAGRARRTASVCTGAFVLAAAGLLDGRRATTHWASCDELRERFPTITVDAAPIFVRDGDVWTSAGVTAGIDLSLALIEDDLGAESAREIARWLVVFLQRPGGQAQFSAQLASQPAARAPLRELQAWIVEHVDADLRVDALAERVAMSPRNFARAFRREVGLTPASFVEAVRVESARRRLERGAEPVDEIACRVGFGTPETMRRAFSRRLGVAPAEYRSRFYRDPQTSAL